MMPSYTILLAVGYVLGMCLTLWYIKRQNRINAIKRIEYDKAQKHHFNVLIHKDEFEPFDMEVPDRIIDGGETLFLIATWPIFWVVGSLGKIFDMIGKSKLYRGFDKWVKGE